MKVLYVDDFKSTFNGKEYRIVRFINPYNLQILCYSCDSEECNLDLKSNELYHVELAIKNNKVKIAKILED